jgi:hypothetical protein
LSFGGRDVSCQRSVKFDEIAETPLGLRRHAAGFPVLNRSLGHADRDGELPSETRPARPPRGSAIWISTVSSAAIVTRRPVSRGQRCP